MKIDKKHIKIIQQRFSLINTRQELLALINYANKHNDGKNFKPIALNQLTYYAIPKNRDQSYYSFSIPKKSGKKRTICSPEKELKNIQKGLSVILNCIYHPHKSVKGFINGLSVVDNAKIHLGQNYVYNIDLKDFFPSIEQARVWACLKLAPFVLNDDKDKNDELNVNTGVRVLYTEHNEKLHYRIIENDLSFVPGMEDDFKKFITRIQNESLQSLKEFLNKINNNDDISSEKYFEMSESEQLELINKYGYTSPTWAMHELERLVYSEPNISKLKKLQSSRQLVNNIISTLCCVEMMVERNINGETIMTKRSVLPQGAPTSPVLSNIVCQRLDFLLTGLAKRFNLKYTRYADDITFSSMHNVYKKKSTFIQELDRIITDQGFETKTSKTRLQKYGYRQEVTGLVVNEKVNVKKSYIKELRMWLYYWDKYGYEKAESLFRKDYIRDKGHVKNNTAKLKNVLFGKLEYVKMVKGNNDTTYRKLNKKFEKLKAKLNSINKIIDIWEKEGIESAISHYEKNGLVYTDLRTYLSHIKANHVLLEKDIVKFKNDVDETIDAIIVSKKARHLISQSLLIEHINDNSSPEKWYVFHNKYKNVKILFRKNKSVPKDNKK